MAPNALHLSIHKEINTYLNCGEIVLMFASFQHNYHRLRPQTSVLSQHTKMYTNSIRKVSLCESIKMSPRQWRTHTLTSVRIKHYATLNLRLIRITVCGTGSRHFIQFQFNMVNDAIFRAHLKNTKFNFFSLWGALLMSNLTNLGLHLSRKRLQQVKFNFILIIKCLCG